VKISLIFKLREVNSTEVKMKVYLAALLINLTIFSTVAQGGIIIALLGGGDNLVWPDKKLTKNHIAGFLLFGIGAAIVVSDFAGKAGNFIGAGIVALSEEHENTLEKWTEQIFEVSSEHPDYEYYLDALEQLILDKQASYDHQEAGSPVFLSKEELATINLNNTRQTKTAEGQTN
jgi:hypothetical protein